MDFSGISLPSVNENSLNSAKERRQILDSLFQLNQQLRYMMGNIGVENLDSELSSFVTETTAEGVRVTREIRTLTGDVSRIRQSGKAIEMSVEDAFGQISLLRQTADAIEQTVQAANGDISTLRQTAQAIQLRVEEEGQRITDVNGNVEEANRKIGELTVTAQEIGLRVEETGQRIEDVNGDVIDTGRKLSELQITARAIESRVYGESRVYRQDTPPVPSLETPVEDGDLWVDTADYNAIYRFENGAWKLSDGRSLDERMAVAEQNADDLLSESETLAGLITVAESKISQNSDRIELTVQKNDVISAINQTAETITIQATRINFNGAISANGNFRINPDGTVEAVNGRFGGELTADVTYCNSLQFRSGSEMLIGQWHIGYQGIYYPSGQGFNYLAFLYQYGQAYVTAQAHMNLGPDPSHNLYVTGNLIDFSITSNQYTVEMTTVPNYSQLSFVPNVDRTCNLGCGPIGGAGSRMWDYAAIRYIYCPDGVHSGSSEVIKHGIRLLDDQGDVIDSLDPIVYILNDDPTEREQLGFVYEKTVGIAPSICSQRVAGDPYTAGIDYSRASVIAIREIKSLRKRVSTLEERIHALETIIEGKG